MRLLRWLHEDERGQFNFNLLPVLAAFAVNAMASGRRGGAEATVEEMPPQPEFFKRKPGPLPEFFSRTLPPAQAPWPPIPQQRAAITQELADRGILRSSFRAPAEAVPEQEVAHVEGERQKQFGFVEAERQREYAIQKAQAEREFAFEEAEQRRRYEQARALALAQHQYGLRQRRAAEVLNAPTVNPFAVLLQALNTRRG